MESPMIRFVPFAVVLAVSALLAGLAAIGAVSYWWSAALTPFAVIGIADLAQRAHSVLRNYPLIGHSRWMIEGIRPQIRQYLVEGDTEGSPFDREHRSLAYQRAKNVVDVMPFGTERNVMRSGYQWINHSIAPRPKAEERFRIQVGGRDCARPYSASVLNVSAMSFGALSGNAILALNEGARRGGFAHDTGEGGLSRYHQVRGGDLIWEIGSGYFGCRTADGAFDPAQFAERARDDQVKMVEIKLSQGAKAGHGGILPGRKVTPEIAAARGVPAGVDCISPASHSSFTNPLELMEFLARLRGLSGGKPAGFKLCIGHKWEFLAICKAMLETGITPDFIVIDGKEGGTGAGPVEFSDHVGTPLRDGLLFALNALTGCGLRRSIRVAASGKIITGFDMAVNMALGADWCNAARGFMFALGCLQSQRCHTNRCPVGVATQDPTRARALAVNDKAERVRSFHRHTVDALMEIVAAAGLDHPSQLAPEHVNRRISEHHAITLAETYDFLEDGQITAGELDREWRTLWRLADPASFRPAGTLASQTG
jgi:glutamate synthase domain-containing protein 2